MRFLADESCDFAVVAALRAADYDVVSVSELSAGSADDVVLRLARSEARVLLTEDKDFGVLAYAGGAGAGEDAGTRIEQTLSSIEGVLAVSVNLPYSAACLGVSIDRGGARERAEQVANRDAGATSADDP